MCNIYSNNVIIRIDFVLDRTIATWLICVADELVSSLQRLQTNKKLRMDLYDNALGRSGEDDSSNDVIGADIGCFHPGQHPPQEQSEYSAGAVPL